MWLIIRHIQPWKGVSVNKASIAMLFICAGILSAQSDVGDSIYDFTVKDIDGNEVSLERFRGKVIMIVNVASKCGFTPQYEGLQSIYERYKDKDFVILGFPANNFFGQEPDTDDAIKSFCTLNYGVSFPMFSKISVKGKTIHPLYRYLTSKKTNPEFGGSITWNFNKFLVDREGRIVARFQSKQKPESSEVVEVLESYLN
jgi:glutathione peroxidase